MASPFRRASSGARRPPRTRSRAATGTTTGGRGSTRRARRAPSRAATRATTTIATRDDIALLADLGFNAYRFSLEWSRIEPEEGEFSRRGARPLPAHVRRCREHGLEPDRHLPPLHDAALGGGARRLDRARRPPIASRASASARPRTSATWSAVLHAQRAQHRRRPSGYLLGIVPARAVATAVVRLRANDVFIAAHRRARRRHQGRARRRARRPHARDAGLCRPSTGGEASRDARAPPTWRTCSSRRRAATTSSASRPTRRIRFGPDGDARPEAGVRDARRWATSSGRRRWRRRSAARGEVTRQCRSWSPRTASAPTDDARAHRVRRAARSRGVLALPRTTASTCAATSTGACSTTSSGPSATRPQFGLVAVDRDDAGAHARSPARAGSARSRAPTPFEG